MSTADDEFCPGPRLLAARRRYFELRASLPCDCDLDLDLHSELTEVIRLLDAKIARLFPDPTLA
jgi:hypothetical protein